MRITNYAEKITKHCPSFIYKAGAQLWANTPYPRHLFIETTSACNLHCGYCPRPDISNHMDYSLFKDIIDEASRYGPRSFSFHLFGEPLLCPWLPAGLRYIKRKNRNHTSLLTTNGILLNDFIPDILPVLDRIHWTWRPQARFTERTIQELSRWGKFLVRIIEEITPQEGIEQWKNWTPLQHRSLHNYGGHIELGNYRKKTSSSSGSGSTSGGETSKNGCRWPCYHLWLAPAIGWNGQVLACCADPSQTLKIGTFPTVAQAWKSPALRQMRKDHLQRTPMGICKKCNVWSNYPDMFYSWEMKDSQ